MNRILFSAFLLVFLASCSSQTTTSSSVQGEMRDIYSTSRRLYQLVWSQDVYRNDQYDKELMDLLKRLSSDFHQAAKFKALQGNDPTFPIVLETTQSMLGDAKVRLAAGARDYAIWRVRGLTSNCIACHSRYEVNVDFSGDAILVEDHSVAAKLHQAEFLVATRQFTRAEQVLRSLATTFAGGGTVSQREMFQVLKLWLVVEVRVKDTPDYSSSLLADLMEKQDFAPDLEELLKRWESDLKKLSSEKQVTSLEEAARALEAVRGNVLYYTDELNLVRTLQASSILHKLLQGEISAEDKRRATLLLAEAYLHIPIRSFEVFPELYLERCIREFPNTQEAQRAFDLLEKEVGSKSTGSSGLNLDPEDEERLEKLRLLAYGLPDIQV